MSNKEIKAEDFNLLEENKDDWKQSTIERVNVSTEFTPALIEEHQGDLQKMEKELTSQLSLAKATVENIERNHEFVKELDEEQRHHVWMLYENLQVVKNAENKLEQVKDQLGQYEQLMEIIHDKFGFVKSELNEPEKGTTEE